MEKTEIVEKPVRLSLCDRVSIYIIQHPWLSVRNKIILGLQIPGVITIGLSADDLLAISCVENLEKQQC